MGGFSDNPQTFVTGCLLVMPSEEYMVIKNRTLKLPEASLEVLTIRLQGCKDITTSVLSGALYFLLPAISEWFGLLLRPCHISSHQSVGSLVSFNSQGIERIYVAEKAIF